MPAILLWFLGPIGRYVLIAVVVGGFFAWGRQHYIDIGYAKAISAIAAQDAQALKEAADAKNKVEKCFASGGSWDISNSVCIPAGKP